VRCPRCGGEMELATRILHPDYAVDTYRCPGCGLEVRVTVVHWGSHWRTIGGSTAYYWTAPYYTTQIPSGASHYQSWTSSTWWASGR